DAGATRDRIDELRSLIDAADLPVIG
ncbi:MAG: hypothetical protein JWR77_254, partial [Rhizorhabdus sp.]|nr:hypothetical protein [Rhizorhabdus sp.]